MAKKATRKPKNLFKVKMKSPPIVVVPDKSYIGATGDIIPTDVILIADPIMYQKMRNILGVWSSREREFRVGEGV